MVGGACRLVGPVVVIAVRDHRTAVPAGVNCSASGICEGVLVKREHR